MYLLRQRLQKLKLIRGLHTANMRISTSDVDILVNLVDSRSKLLLSRSICTLMLIVFSDISYRTFTHIHYLMVTILDFPILEYSSCVVTPFARE